MSGDTLLRLLLGPQRPECNLGHAMSRAAIGDAPIAVISAAWQEAEGDIDPLQQQVSNPLTDLRLNQKADALFAADKPLHEAYRLRQERLQEQQRLYRLRLKQLNIAARETLRASGDSIVVAAERRHAISQLRALDRHHLRQVGKVHNRFDSAFDVAVHPSLVDHAAAIEEELSNYETVMITGGNVVVLVNRLRLFGLERLLRQKNIIAWSAGAMVLCDRIVLFHDRLPQGRRDAEIMCKGLGILPGVVLLPDAKGRLRSRNTSRISLFDRRFSPATCFTLDNGSHLLFAGGTLQDSQASLRMTRSGKLQRVRAT